MNYYVVVLFSLTICIPAMIGLFRFNKINESYHPFIFYIWIGAINEIVGLLMIYFYHTNIVNLNIYLLLESLILTWQFYHWGLFNRKKKWLLFIAGSLILFWLFENLILFSIDRYASYFTIFYATIFTFMSISSINLMIVTERKSLLKSPRFIICSAFSIYFTILILAEVFWIYGVSQSVAFTNYVNFISNITNFIAIILYTLAILWMPIKHRFTLPSS